VPGATAAVRASSSECPPLNSDEVGFPNTTAPDELVQLTAGHARITVFATYASSGLGILEAAHPAARGPWNLIIVDEAHRTSGRAGKPWAVVHDNTRILAERRLYMTATPRAWQAGEADEDTPRAGRRSRASWSPPRWTIWEGRRDKTMQALASRQAFASPNSPA
jgi:predicted helicase